MHYQKFYHEKAACKSKHESFSWHMKEKIGKLSSTKTLQTLSEEKTSTKTKLVAILQQIRP